MILNNDPQHIAYEVAMRVLEDAKRKAVQEFLDKVDSCDSQDIDDVDSALMSVTRAFDLCHLAQKISGEMMQSHDYSKAIALLKKRLPGYSDHTYTLAINDAFAKNAR